MLSFQNEPCFLYTPDCLAVPSSRNPSLHWLTSTDPSSLDVASSQGAFPGFPRVK